jgi:nitrogen fixation protein FixH
MNAPLSGRKVLLLLIAFFGVIFAVNTFFIVQAVTTFRGEDEQDSYLQGINYNQTLAQRKAQAALGWQASVEPVGAKGEGTRILVRLTGPTQAPITDAAVKGLARHPSDATRDRALSCREAEPGDYICRGPRLSEGYWDLVVDAKTKTSVPFEASARLWLP